MPSFSTNDQDGVLVITLNDPTPLNDFRPNAFRDELYGTVQGLQRPRVALDLSVAEFLASSGIAILVSLKRRIDAQEGKLVLIGVQPSVQGALKIMKLNQYFLFAEDRDEALALLRSLSTA